jgi:hypothetical protein
LAGHCRSDAELLEMIVTADLAHKRKKWTRREENRKAIANDDEGCRDSERCEQQHRSRHHNRGDQSGEQPGRDCFRSAHDS